ncbi:MAG: glycerol-3-phosphate 1-O-acyltransferase PlsY [Planctomycetia bacterium]
MHIGSPWAEALAALLAYLVGGIPFGWLAARALKGVDLRTVGSGNIGATNASRLWLGKASILVFVAVFLLDCFKGFCAAHWSSSLGGWLASRPLGTGEAEGLQIACGAAALLGHVFTPWLRFKGGKGVATALGVVTALAPWSSVYALGVWAVLVLLTRYMSLGSIVAVLSIPVTYLLQRGEQAWTQHPAALAFLVLMAVVVVWRHRDNIRRLLQGSERRIGDPSQLSAR